MSNLNTELMTALLKNESIDEVFCSQLEAAMNELLKIELTQFLGYEKTFFFLFLFYNLVVST